MAQDVDTRGREIRPVGTGPAGRGARGINIVLGAWLFISAFVWPHSAAARTNTWICGLLAVAFAVWALWAPATRWLTTALAIWLFISTLSIFHVSEATLWNNVIVAILLFIFSLVPSALERRGGFVEA